MSDPVGSEMFKSLELFVEGIEAHKNLEMVGEYRKLDGSGATVLVIQDNRLAEDVEGHQTTVDLAEIFSTIKNNRLRYRLLFLYSKYGL